MKGLKTLIRLSKRVLDELRRKLTNLENQKAALEQAIIAIQMEMDAEMISASKQPEMSQFFGGFASRLRARQDELRAEIRKLDKQMDDLRTEITAAFADLKKYEIALDMAKQREKEKQQRIETDMMDEIAAQQHLRKQDS